RAGRTRQCERGDRPYYRGGGDPLHRPSWSGVSSYFRAFLPGNRHVSKLKAENGRRNAAGNPIQPPASHSTRTRVSLTTAPGWQGDPTGAGVSTGATDEA